MSSWASVFVWVGLYWITLWVVPNKKLCKGLFTRHVLKRVVPPKRFWRTGSGGHVYRYWLWLITSITVTTVFAIKGQGAELFFWGPIVVVLLDDYIFGDDDAWKRRWEGAKNKIKWLMDLPPQPVKVRETA